LRRQDRTQRARATLRLPDLVSGGDLDLKLVRCSCREDTQGTKLCNYGRACGVLIAEAEDVGATLIAEGLGGRKCAGTTGARGGSRGVERNLTSLALTFLSGGSEQLIAELIVQTDTHDVIGEMRVQRHSSEQRGRLKCR
jgi:hypothetical protein